MKEVLAAQNERILTLQLLLEALVDELIETKKIKEEKLDDRFKDKMEWAQREIKKARNEMEMDYLIGFLLIILLPASIIFNILLLIRGINFVKQNEQLMDTIRDYDDRQISTQIKIESMLQKMKEIDIRGSFESDDEVGAVFSELKETIETYKNEI